MVKGKLLTIVTVNNYKHKHDVFLGSEKIQKTSAVFISVTVNGR